jgi:hypothetical protein
MTSSNLPKQQAGPFYSIQQPKTLFPKAQADVAGSALRLRNPARVFTFNASFCNCTDVLLRFAK